jgi:tetratricopeptide (TPR) repeat protein
MGHLEQALTLCESVIEMLHEVEHEEKARIVGASTWDTLGCIHHRIGDHARAVAAYKMSIELYSGLLDPYQNGMAYLRLGDVHAHVGAFGDAHAAWTQALAVFEELGLPITGEIRARLAGAEEPSGAR